MQRLKILYTIPNFKTAGSQYVLLSLFRNIDKTLYEPYVCVENFPELIPEDIPTERQLLFAWTGNNFRDIINFGRLLKKHEIDLVHSWDYKSNFWEPMATRLAGTKYLFTKKNNAWSKRWRLKSFLSNHIVYDNPEMKTRFFKSFFFRNKTSFIPHGVNTEVFKPLPKNTHSTFTIGSIGNIGSNKNQLFIVKALTELPKDVVLHLYGNEDVAYRALLDDYISKNKLEDRVKFHGFVKNAKLPEVYSNLDLFVLASLQEGLPVSILEAMACGVSVLSTDSGGGARYILKSGGGFVFDVNNVQSLTAHIVRLMQNPQEMEEVSKAGRKNAVRNFSAQSEVSVYEELYLRI